ncbi:MAG: hypothetical protein QNJ51_13915 [Calothrix sp. MO_167.B12]|nr:hypothetical protein [Calothrix sp. MO_167.B12]
MALIKVAVATGSNVYTIRQPRGIYTGQIATECGITETIAAEQKDEPVIPVNEMIRVNKVNRLRAVYLVSGRRRYQDILVAEEKLDTARKNLIGKTINGRTIIDLINKREAYIN